MTQVVEPRGSTLTRTQRSRVAWCYIPSVFNLNAAVDNFVSGTTCRGAEGSCTKSSNKARFCSMQRGIFIAKRNHNFLHFSTPSHAVLFSDCCSAHKFLFPLLLHYISFPSVFCLALPLPLPTPSAMETVGEERARIISTLKNIDEIKCLLDSAAKENSTRNIKSEMPSQVMGLLADIRSLNVRDDAEHLLASGKIATISTRFFYLSLTFRFVLSTRCFHVELSNRIGKVHSR